MMDPENEAVLAPLRAKVKEQGDLVRAMKAEGKPELDVKKAVAELKVGKKVILVKITSPEGLSEKVRMLWQKKKPYRMCLAQAMRKWRGIPP